MHQVSLKKICPLEAFQLHYCPDNDAKSMVKHFIFLQKFAVLNSHLRTLADHRTVDYCLKALCDHLESVSEPKIDFHGTKILHNPHGPICEETAR